MASAFTSGTKGLLYRTRFVDTSYRPGASAGSSNFNVNINNVIAIELSPFTLPRLPKGEFLDIYFGSVKVAIELAYKHTTYDDLTSGSYYVPEEYLDYRPDGTGLSTDSFSHSLDNMMVIRLADYLMVNGGPSVYVYDAAGGDFLCDLRVGDKYSISPGKVIATPRNKLVFNTPTTISTINPIMFSPISNGVFLDYGEPTTTGMGYDAAEGALFVVMPFDNYQVPYVGDYIVIQKINSGPTPAGAYLAAQTYAKSGLIVYKLQNVEVFGGPAWVKMLLSPMPIAMKTALESMTLPADGIVAEAIISNRSYGMRLFMKFTVLDSTTQTQFVTPTLAV